MWCLNEKWGCLVTLKFNRVICVNWLVLWKKLAFTKLLLIDLNMGWSIDLSFEGLHSSSNKNDVKEPCCLGSSSMLGNMCGGMKFFLLYAFITVLTCLWHQALHAETFSLTGNWNYQNTNDATDSFTESYSFNAVHGFEFTDAMSLDTAIRLNRSKTPTVSNENITPTASYLVTNDLFVLNVSGTASEEFNSQAAENSSKSLAINWSSNWKKERWVPYIGLNYNKSWQEDDQDPHVVNTDSKSTGLNMEWEFLLSKLFYSYNFNESNNDVSSSQGQSGNHFARFETSRIFWRDKASVSFSQQYNSTNNVSTLAVSGGTAMLPITVSTFSDEVNPPAGTYLLSSNGLLSNGDNTDSAVTTTNDANLLHIAVRTDSRSVTMLYLYTDSTLAPAAYSAFHWDLYSSSANSVWVLEKTGLTASYNSVKNRFEIDISGFTRDYLGVVAATDAGATLVTFTEVEVFQQIAASGTSTVVKSRLVNHKTDVGFALQVKQNLQLTSTFSYEQNDSSSGPDLNSLKANGGLSWSPLAEVNVRLNSDYTSRKRENALEEQTRQYSVNVAFPVLPTVDAVAGASLSEMYEGTRKLSVTYNYNLQTVASLYEDLDGRFNVSFRQNEDTVAESNTNSTSAQLVLTARLIPGLVADLSTNYNKTSSQSPTVDSSLNAHWRLSEMLAVTGGYSQTWGPSDASSASLGFDLAMTRNMQISLSHSMTIRPGSSQTTSLDWRWTISRYISLLTAGVYQSGEGPEAWSVSSRLNARFSVM